MTNRVTNYTTSDGLLGKTVRLDPQHEDELIQVDALHAGFGLTWSTELLAADFLEIVNLTAILTPESQFTAWFVSEGKETSFSAREVLDRYKEKPRNVFWGDCYFFSVELETLAIGWEAFPRFADEDHPHISAIFQGPKYCSIRSGYYDPDSVQSFVRSTASKKVSDQFPDLWKEVEYLLENVKREDLPLKGGDSFGV